MADVLHVVKQGEWLGLIATRYGFSDTKEILNFERNKRLKDTRPNPNELLPGDEVWIPGGRKEIEVQTKLVKDKVWKASIDLGPDETLELIIRDANDKPLANTDYVIRLGAFEKPGKTDGKGKLKETLSTALLDIEQPKLVIAGQTLPLAIGHLDPADSLSGAQGRLRNLGYYEGDVDGELNPGTRDALFDFQSDNKLPADGLPTPQTLKKLDELYKAQ